MMKRIDIIISILLVLGTSASLISDFWNVFNVPIVIISSAYFYLVFKLRNL